MPDNPEDKITVKDLSVRDITMDDLFDAVKDLKNITKSFGSAGKRNTKKTDFKLNKHCMHLIRGMLMGIEILQTGVVKTYRKNDLPLLRSILNGDYMKDGHITPEFYELVEKLRKEAEYAYKNTVLQQEPDKNKVSDMLEMFLMVDLQREG